MASDGGDRGSAGGHPVPGRRGERSAKRGRTPQPRTLPERGFQGDRRGGGAPPRQPCGYTVDSPPFVNGVEGGAITPHRGCGGTRRRFAKRPGGCLASPRTGGREKALGATVGPLPELAPEGLWETSQLTPWGHTPCVPCGGWRGAAPPLTPGFRPAAGAAGGGVLHPPSPVAGPQPSAGPRRGRRPGRRDPRRTDQPGAWS